MKVITPEFIADYFKIDLPEAEGVFKALDCIHYKNGENIVTVGDPADGLYFIEDGQATVLNKDGEAVNEMSAGHYFGEYAILANEPRLTTVKAHGKVIAYRLKSEDFMQIVACHPEVTGRLLKQVYGQISQKHTRLTSLTHKHRGVLFSPGNNRDNKLSSILITYIPIIVLFIYVFISVRIQNEFTFMMQILPMIFLLAFTLWTKRVLEGMLLTVILLAGMLNQGDFINGLGNMMIEGIGNPSTAETIVIMALVECVAALLAKAGVVSAFKKLSREKIHNRKQSLLGMFFIMVAVCIDECLNIVTAAFCTKESMEEHKVSAEHRALLASSSMAICSLIPFSLWSCYIYGWISMYYKNSGHIFLQVIPKNMAGIYALILSLLLCFDLLPETKTLKKANERIENSGKLWPEGSEQYFDNEMDDEVVGKTYNLILPMIVWMISSIFFGYLNNDGSFALEPIPGLIMTLIFMFGLYVSQRLLSPKDYFESMAEGIGNSLMPILLLVFAERIAESLSKLGFIELLEGGILLLVGDKLYLLPLLVFVAGLIVGVILRSCWGMYGLGIPIAIFLAKSLNVDVTLCLAAILAAGIIGENLNPYLDETSPMVGVIGCEPRVYRKLRVEYWLLITLLCAISYLLLGFILI
ncbi:MAG: cyclic nucleotide-binding domain-containing protein [Erysipelotrichaceae bacterium]|nr:cyclic nucleotide-binding domain-containing protein [Erysipelotrichaceae bacterium]